MWEDHLRGEQYRPMGPNNEKVIIAMEQGEGYLWGFFGLSDGGGWRIWGRLEAEVPIQEGLLQLYSRGATKWSPGFMLIEPRYDRKKYPIWEFRLILRDPVHRQEVQTLKSVPVPAQEVLQHPQFRFNPDDPRCPLGHRCPRGELQYKETRKMAIVKILGILHPFSVEVLLSQVSEPDENERK